MGMTQMHGRQQPLQPRIASPASRPSVGSRDEPAMKSRRAMHRTRRRLTHIRLEIAKAQAALAALQAAIRVARSDPGVVAAQDMRTQNENLAAANRLATEEVSAARTARDVAVRASQTDPLTGLSNRTLLWDRLSHEIDVANRQGHRVAVFLLDLDDFKTFNDRFGHGAGDRVLQRVASVLTDSLRASDTICRIGGDEFVVVAPAATPQDAALLASKIEEELREPFLLAGQSTAFSASVGFSVYPEDGHTAQALVQRADEAMYRMKRARNDAIVGDGEVWANR
jgi:diguanylate cyclase (GGDEF)-like protein